MAYSGLVELTLVLFNARGANIFTQTLQADITKFEEDFEKSGDPFSVMDNGNHLNSVAGVLKSYFRKLEEPLFSEAYFDQFMNITSETGDIIQTNILTFHFSRTPRSYR